MKNYPSTQSLRALTSFARTGSVWKTADELNLTPSAVTYQLRLLERSLGFKLFQRVGTRVSLTEQGQAFALDVRQALATISSSAARYGNKGVSGTINICSTPGFAGGWLCSNIAGFNEAYPDVRIRLQTQPVRDGVGRPDIDAFIVFGGGYWPDMEVSLLVEIEITPVCSPNYAHAVLKHPPDLKKVRFLQIVGDEQEWELWLAAAGADPLLARNGITFFDANLCYSAAMYSQGIALGDQFTCRAALANGLLIRPFEVVTRSRRSYYLVCPASKAESPTVAAFSTWIKSEIVGAGHPDPTGEF